MTIYKGYKIEKIGNEYQAAANNIGRYKTLVQIKRIIDKGIARIKRNSPDNTNGLWNF